MNLKTRPGCVNLHLHGKISRCVVAITKKDVMHVAELARLALTEEEIELYTGQLSRILGYVEKLSELKTGGVTPVVYTEAPGAFLREDAAKTSPMREYALSNAPEEERGCFKVPKIIE